MKKVISIALALVALSGCFCVPSGEPPEGNVALPAVETIEFASLNEMKHYWINTLPGVLAVKAGFGVKVTIWCSESLNEGITMERQIIEDAVIMNGGKATRGSRYKIFSNRKQDKWEISLYNGNQELWKRTLIIRNPE